MDVTPTTLTRSAGLAAIAAGTIFIAVQLNVRQSNSVWAGLRTRSSTGRGTP